VVMGVGIGRNREIGKDGGLIVNGGIVVNEYMVRNDEWIYGVGECGEDEGMAYGVVAAVYEEGAILAKDIRNLET
ncbi:hypothetical protein, partial [Bacillus thuringiensis]|uniref:hypothetical protein n=1 Tax=Bacillus thuringiensis TaxID=1428 RepID=UPI0021B503AA